MLFGSLTEAEKGTNVDINYKSSVVKAALDQVAALTSTAMRQRAGWMIQPSELVELAAAASHFDLPDLRKMVEEWAYCQMRIKFRIVCEFLVCPHTNEVIQKFAMQFLIRTKPYYTLYNDVSIVSEPVLEEILKDEMECSLFRGWLALTIVSG